MGPGIAGQHLIATLIKKEELPSHLCITHFLIAAQPIERPFSRHDFVGA